MIIWIIQNLTEKGGQSVRSVSKVVYTMRLQQTKTCQDKSPPGGPSGRLPPPFFKKKEGVRGQQGSLITAYSVKENIFNIYDSPTCSLTG